jgi:hypothetical protein
MPGKPSTRYANHPLVKFVRDLDGDYYLTREVAEQLDCSESMLIYLRRRSEKPLGPTHQASYGGIGIHLYTPERIAEIAQYLAENSGRALGYKRRGPALLWTKAEQLERDRDKMRARNYRVRGAAYAAQGEDEKAARMEKMNTELQDRLARDKAKRYLKVHGKPMPEEST